MKVLVIELHWQNGHYYTISILPITKNVSPLRNPETVLVLLMVIYGLIITAGERTGTAMNC